MTALRERASHWARMHPRQVDSLASALLFVLAVVGARLVQLGLIDSTRDIASLRAAAEAAVKQGGKTEVDARRALELLTQPQRLAMIWIYLLAVASTLPTMFRRRFPGSVHVVVFGAFLLTQYFSPFDSQIATVTAFLTTYTYAAYSDHSSRVRRTLLFVTAVLTLMFATGVVRNRNYYPEPIRLRELLFGLCVASVLYGSSIAIGLVVRRQHETAAVLAAHATMLAYQQEVMARTAVFDERVRIARELHDVVAHHVSVMGMQAGAARLRLGSNDSPVSKALSNIEQSSREAVADLYRLLGLLRSGDSPGAEVQSPQPSLQLATQLLADHRTAGYPIALEMIGDVDDLPTTTSLTAFRIIQEALTNIRKHGSLEGPARIAIVRTHTELRLDIFNTMIGGSNASGPRTTLQVVRPTSPQLGIRGMVERAVLVGGTVTAGLVSSTEFRVHAVIPVEARTCS